MTSQIRVLTDFAELARSQTVFAQSMVGIRVPASGPSADDFEPGRTFGAFVDDELVGTVTSFAAELIVPGGARVAHTCVSDVGVLPTHTRRGLATAMLEAQLRDIAERGDIIATLRASQAVIYERFGYGIASAAATLELTTAQARLRPSVPVGGPVRFVDPAHSFELLEKIYAGVDRPGIMRRPGYWWRHQALGAARPDARIEYVAVHGPAGAEDGYLRYHPNDVATWFTSTNRTIVVTDLVAVGPEATAGLLRHLLSVDLVQRIVLDIVPIDHGIEKLLVDERAAATVSIEDETWLRLIDVEAALAARTYRGPATVTIAVSDPQLPANTGVYSISAGQVRRVTGVEPQLSLDVAALGAVYLSGTKWWQIARAGRVTQHQDGALAVAEQLFATDQPPFAGTMF